MQLTRIMELCLLIDMMMYDSVDCSPSLTTSRITTDAALTKKKNTEALKDSRILSQTSLKYHFVDPV